MHQIYNNKIRYFSLLVFIAVGLFVSACSSGNDGGSVSGAGSSSVQGNVSSITMAMLKSMESEDYSASGGEYSLVVFLKSLLPVQSAFADSTIEGVHVTIGQLGTTTNSQGYFRIDGVPPGTHEMVFLKNNQTSRTTVRVGENEMVTMTNISMRGSHAYQGNVGHQVMGGNSR